MRTLIPHVSLLASLLVGPGSLLGQIAVLGDLSNDRQTMPGEKYQGTVTVSNDSQEPQEAKIYLRDYSFQADGTNNYGEPGSLPRSNARWITFTPAHLVLLPGTTADISYAVSVPKDTSGALAGTFWSMLMVEGIPNESLESTIRPAGAPHDMGVMQTIRYGIQIASHIQSTARKDVRLTEPRIIKNPEGSYSLHVDVQNTGNAGMRPEVYVDLFDQRGTKVGRYAGTRYRLYPETSVRQVIGLTTVQPGTYKALVVIDDGGSDIFGAQYTLQF